MGARDKEFRFHEGCLDHKWENSYRKLWMVMKRNIIYIFRDRPFIPENHEGTLTIDETTKFEIRPEKPNNYKFMLYTSNRRRINTFKSDKKSERDLWRGYIVGVAKQKVPDDLDLPREIINKIKQDVGNFHLSSVFSGQQEPDVVSRISGGNVSSSSRSPRQSLGSGRSNPQRQSVMSGDSGVSGSMGQRSGSSGSGSMTIDGVGGGPFMRHRFSSNHENSFTPSWFFEACTREKAESYLAIAAEKGFGNTLMRESTKFKQDGSYVISKRLVHQGSASVEHYEVIRVDRGYKIKVENPHDAMRNLSEVMDYFVVTSGIHATLPLNTNRLSDYGMAEDPYNTGRIVREDTDTGQEEPAPDYEEPVQHPARIAPVPARPPPVLKSRQGHHTVRPTGTSFSLEIDDTINVNQACYPYSTEKYPKEYKQMPGKPSLEDIETDFRTAAAIDMFNRTIDPFDEPADEQDYINLRDLQRTDDELSVATHPKAPSVMSIPPLPKPHQPTQLHYLNEPHQPGMPQEIAPPVPHAPLPKVPHIHSEPVIKDCDTRNGVPSPRQLGLKPTKFEKADPSQGEIMRPTGKSQLTRTKSLGTPKADFPTPQQMGLKPTKISQSMKEQDKTENDNQPEIDQSPHQDVSDIKRRFERNSVGEQPLSPNQVVSSVGSLQVTNPLPKPCSSEQQYCNIPNQSEESHYDDGVTPSAPEPCGRLRSKSTPTISPEIRRQLEVSRNKVVSSSFRRNLENMLGNQRRVLVESTSQGGATEEEHYEYLPD